MKPSNPSWMEKKLILLNYRDKIYNFIQKFMETVVVNEIQQLINKQRKFRSYFEYY